MYLLDELPEPIINRILNECMDQDHFPDPDKLIALLKAEGFRHLINDALEDCVEVLHDAWVRREMDRVALSN